MKIPDRDWSVHVYDADVDAAAELVTGLATTYAQLAAEDSIEVVSSAAGDITQTVTVVTIDDEGKRVENVIALNTTAGTTAVTLAGATHRYYEGAKVDAECAGTITIRRATGDTFIDSIPIGQVKSSGAVQHFNGLKYTRLKKWWASNLPGTDDVVLELRFYPDDADCLDSGDGYEVVDRIQLGVSQIDSPPHELNDRVYAPGGWFAVFGTGASADEKVSVTLTGRDSNS